MPLDFAVRLCSFKLQMDMWVDVMNKEKDLSVCLSGKRFPKEEEEVFSLLPLFIQRRSHTRISWQITTFSVLDPTFTLLSPQAAG